MPLTGLQDTAKPIFALEPFGLLSGMEPPLPIPNREVKHASVHDTAVLLLWDNRSRPGDSRAKNFFNQQQCWFFCMNKDRIGELRNSLSHIQGVGENSNIVFQFSNDKEMQNHVLDVIAGVGSIQAETKVGLVVGSGGLFSWGPLLPSIDLWIQIDKNPHMIEWLNKISDIGRQEPRIEDYIAQMFDSLLQVVRENEKQKERPSYGPFYYLHNQQTYARAHEFLKRESVVRMLGNLEDVNFIGQVGAAVKSVEGSIVFANVTNVWDHRWLEDTSGSTIDKALSQLPFHDNANFLSSTTRDLLVRRDIGYSNYRAHAYTNLAEERARRGRLGRIQTFPVKEV